VAYFLTFELLEDEMGPAYDYSKLHVTMADPEILKSGRRAEDSVSVPSSLIANAHNEMRVILEKSAY